MDNSQHSHQENRFPATLNTKKSQQIASVLSKGQIITKQVYKRTTSNLVDNDLYNALFLDLDFYKEMYLHMGWNLVHSAKGEFFYLSKNSEELVEEGDSNSLRVCIPLFYIASDVVKRGFDTNVLWTPHIGLPMEEIEAISEGEDDIAISLEALRYKSNVWHDAVRNLKNKGFVYENSKGNIVFSSAAKYFTETMIEKYSS